MSFAVLFFGQVVRYNTITKKSAAEKHRKRRKKNGSVNDHEKEHWIFGISKYGLFRLSCFCLRHCGQSRIGAAHVFRSVLLFRPCGVYLLRREFCPFFISFIPRLSFAPQKRMRNKAFAPLRKGFAVNRVQAHSQTRRMTFPIFWLASTILCAPSASERGRTAYNFGLNLPCTIYGRISS